VKFENFLDWARLVWFGYVFFPIKILYDILDRADGNNSAAYDLPKQNNVLSSDQEKTSRNVGV